MDEKEYFCSSCRAKSKPTIVLGAGGLGGGGGGGGGGSVGSLVRGRVPSPVRLNNIAPVRLTRYDNLWDKNPIGLSFGADQLSNIQDYPLNSLSVSFSNNYFLGQLEKYGIDTGNEDSYLVCSNGNCALKQQLKSDQGTVSDYILQNYSDFNGQNFAQVLMGNLQNTNVQNLTLEELQNCQPSFYNGQELQEITPDQYQPCIIAKQWANLLQQKEPISLNSRQTRVLEAKMSQLRYCTQLTRGQCSDQLQSLLFVDI